VVRPRKEYSSGGDLRFFFFFFFDFVIVDPLRDGRRRLTMEWQVNCRINRGDWFP